MSAVIPIFLHVDMDAFFAAIEQLDHPELRGKPVVVGSAPDARGVVSTCSYEARQFGIHSAMPSRTAARLCPQAIFLPVRSERYAEMSRRIFAVFRQFAPEVEALSIDEAFLDIGGSMHLFGGAEATGRALKAQMREETGLTASVGIAHNKFLAKLASDLEKPDGLVLIPREQEKVLALLAPLPIRRIWGIGRKTGERLEQHRIRTIGDLQQQSLLFLRRLLGERAGEQIYRLARGMDDRSITPERREKSISNETTFAEDCRDWTRVEQATLHLTEKVGRRLREHGGLAGIVFIKIRWADFTTLSRQRALSRPVRTDRELIEQTRTLLATVREDRAVRLVGVGVSLYQPATGSTWRQPELFDFDREEPEIPEENRRDKALDAAVDAVRKRFGPDSLRRGL